MKKIKVGDYVVRKSYGKDIIFYVKRIIKKTNEDIAILCGLVERIEADSNIDDLEIINEETVRTFIEKENKRNDNRIRNNFRIINNKEGRLNKKLVTGRILHLDGDKRYSQKSFYYYKKLGLNAIVKNIPEYEQPKEVYKLLTIYNPDILVITGHDGMIKKGSNYNDIFNYRNSRHFINTIKEARRYDRENGKETVIFARSLPKLL